MDNLNHVLFEEFKHLDKLCGELYGDQRGVSHYIDDMKVVSGSDYRYIPNWKEDLDQLIRIRHIRNYLAHTEGAFNEDMCTPKDIEWSRDFCRRILDQLDPLALLRQHSEAKQRMAKAKRPVYQIQAPQLSVQYNVVNEKAEKISSILCWIVLLLVIIGGLLLVLFSISQL
ncbi:MAG: hypothetical protein K2J60_15225 [Acetatifactor sp.]|nr:hypothetical protein [Acetatifactor sp.]